jgi:acyl-CoA thioester hydrolase
MMPVLELKCKYIKPAYYDEELTILVKILDKPQTRIKFQYEIFNKKEELINVGETTLVFVDIKKNRPGMPSQDFQKLMDPYFKS